MNNFVSVLYFWVTFIYESLRRYLKKIILKWNFDSSFFLFLFFFLGCFQSKEEREHRFTKVVRKDISQRVTISGHIEPKMKTFIVSPYDGYIQSLFVHVGQNLTANNRLVLISPNLSETRDLYPLKTSHKGTVVKIMSRKGEHVKKNDVILRIDDLSNLFVFAGVPEMDVLKIKKGQHVLIQPVAVSNKKYNGVIKEISISENSPIKKGINRVGSTNYSIQIKITNEDQSLKPGMSAIVDIVTAKKKEALVLPHEFVNRKGGKYFVHLKSGEKKDVQIGIQSDLWIEVLNLNEGLEVRQIDFYKKLK